MSRAVILVEGESDKAAIEALARRRDRDLDAEGVTVVAMGGAGNVRHFVERIARTGVKLAGLYDAGEIRTFRQALEGNGIGPIDTEFDMAYFGFFQCDPDLEGELIRALGNAMVEDVIDSQGELNSFRIMQRQPAHRGRPVEDQLRRFLGTRSGRKVAYGRLLVEALDLENVPPPLDRVLAQV